MPVLFTFNLHTKYEMSHTLTSSAPKLWPGPQNVEMCPDSVPFKNDLSSGAWDLLPLTYRPNLQLLTAAITKI